MKVNERNIYKDIAFQSEEELQQKIIFYFHNNFPSYRGLLFHVPNGDARTKMSGARLKRLGVISGVADLILLYEGVSYFIELKTNKGKQRPTQIEWQKKVELQGFPYTIIRSLKEFKEMIDYIII